MANSLKEKSLSAILWVLVDKVAGSSLNFIVTIILARLLVPEDFGLVAMVMVFFELSLVFVESGFVTAMVREKEISEIDKSTTFIFNLIASLILYCIIFYAAPAIAAFFEQDVLVWIVRIMGLNLIINAFAIVQRAALTQRIDFKTQTKVRVLAIIASGLLAIGLALGHLGVWALVAKFAAMGLMESILLWTLNPWRPSLRFSTASFKRLFGFGSKVLLAAVLDKFYVHIYKVLIGKFFTAALLGFYAQAGMFRDMTINTLFQTIQKVTYPVLSKLQDDRERLKAGYRKVIKLSSFFIIPALVMLAVLARPVILLTIGAQWLPAAPFLQLLCLAGFTYHFSQANLNMLLVLGRSDLSLKLEVLKKVVITIAIVIGLRYGILGLVIGEVISAYINLVFNAYYSSRLLEYSLLQQLTDVLPTVVFSLIIGGIAYLLTKLTDLTDGPLLLLSGVTGISTYVSLHLWFKTEEIGFIRNMVIPKTKQLISSFNAHKIY